MKKRWNSLFFRLSLVMLLGTLAAFILTNIIWWVFLSAEGKAREQEIAQQSVKQVFSIVQKFQKLPKREYKKALQELNVAAEYFQTLEVPISYLEIRKTPLEVEPMPQNMLYTQSYTQKLTQKLPNIKIKFGSDDDDYKLEFFESNQDIKILDDSSPWNEDDDKNSISWYEDDDNNSMSWEEDSDGNSMSWEEDSDGNSMSWDANSSTSLEADSTDSKGTKKTTQEEKEKGTKELQEEGTEKLQEEGTEKLQEGGEEDSLINNIMEAMEIEIEEEGQEIVLLTQIQLSQDHWLIIYQIYFVQNSVILELLSPHRIFFFLVLVLILWVIAYLIVLWIAKPLQQLGKHAEAIGKDILQKNDLTIAGPQEVLLISNALKVMQERIIDQVKEKAHVFAAISHDLKTPITRMRLRTELLEEDLYREKFIQDLGQMEEMVKGALDFVKDTEVQEDKHAIDMNALLQSVVENTQELGAKVSISGTCRAPFQGYPNALKRCISNLIENAVFYGKEAQVQLKDSREQLEIIITDNGPGIPEAQLKQVFTPYYRVESSRNLNTGGTGLGLSIVKKIAQAHLGEIQLRNRKDTHGLEAHLLFQRAYPSS